MSDLEDDDIVVFIDSSDVLVQQGPEVVRQALKIGIWMETSYSVRKTTAFQWAAGRTILALTLVDMCVAVYNFISKR